MPSRKDIRAGPRTASIGNANFRRRRVCKNWKRKQREYIREAKRRDATEADQLASTIVEAVARDYFQHALRKQRRRPQR